MTSAREKDGRRQGRQGVAQAGEVLVLNHLGFGNVVMSIPLLKALSEKLTAGQRLIVLLRSAPHFELLREDLPAIEPRFLHGPGRVRCLLGLRADLRERVRWVIGVPQVPPGTIRLVQEAIGAKESIGEAAGIRRHVLDRWVLKHERRSILAAQEEIGALLGLAVPFETPAIRLTAEEAAWRSSVLAQEGVSTAAVTIGLHCSAAVICKRWPVRKFASVLRAVARVLPEVTVVSFGSSTDYESAQAVRSLSPKVRWIEGAGAWTIRQTLAMLSRCNVVLSGDTGLMHMAAAVGATPVSVFGPTYPERLAPYYARAVAISSGATCRRWCRYERRQCACLNNIEENIVAESLLRVVEAKPVAHSLNASLKVDVTWPTPTSPAAGASPLDIQSHQFRGRCAEFQNSPPKNVKIRRANLEDHSS